MALEDRAPARRRPQPAALLVPFDPRRATLALATIACVLVLVGVATALVYDARDARADRWLELVDVNGEANIPAWFSVSLLTGGAVTVAAVAQHSKRRGAPDATPWAFVSAFFVAMSIDEMVGLHESVGGEVDDLVLFPLIGGYGWLVPGTVIGVVGASVLWRAAASLPAPTRTTVAIAIGLFGCGAVGLEVVEAVVTGESADVGTTFFLVTGAQELLEMLGATLFLYAMLVELQRRSAVVDLRDAVGSGSLDPSEDRARPEPVTRDLFSPHR